jgi:hypothetical protein
MNITYVIYHRADFDGLFCREIARKKLGDENVKYIGWDYGDPLPEIPSGAMLYMLDLSVEGLMNHPFLVWIDHHKSAIEKYPDTIAGYRIDGVAACRLAWQWFASDFEMNFQELNLPIKQEYIDRIVTEPLAVRLAGEYDIWDKRDPRAETFQHGLRGQPLEKMWPLLLRAPEILTLRELEEMQLVGPPLEIRPDGSVDRTTRMVEGILHIGEAIQYASTQGNAAIIKDFGFTFEWEGLRFLACNSARYNSHLFTSGLKPEHDACFGFNWTGSEWRVSLYHAPGKEQHDLSLIAAKHGGGGHRGACGFRAKTLPFLVS